MRMTSRAEFGEQTSNAARRKREQLWRTSPDWAAPQSTDYLAERLELFHPILAADGCRENPVTDPFENFQSHGALGNQLSRMKRSETEILRYPSVLDVEVQVNEAFRSSAPNAQPRRFPFYRARKRIIRSP